jgi:guanylate kinase
MRFDDFNYTMINEDVKRALNNLKDDVEQYKAAIIPQDTPTSPT